MTLGRLFGPLLCVLTGCATTVEPYMAPTPVAFKLERLDLVAALPAGLRTTQVPVFYATTRAPAEPGEPGHYRNSQDEHMRLGVARVVLGEPGWGWAELVASDRSDTITKARPGRVEGVDEIGVAPRDRPESDTERAFVERINARPAEIRNPQIVVYVHGYKVTSQESKALFN